MLVQVADVVPLASSRPLENIWTAGTSSSGMVSPNFAPRCCHSSRAGLGRHPLVYTKLAHLVSTVEIAADTFDALGFTDYKDVAKALVLIKEAALAGADAAKFQHFSAETIVSDYGFRSLGDQISHQAKWKKSVFEVYKDASIPLDWTSKLKEECQKNKIEFSQKFPMNTVLLLQIILNFHPKSLA